MPFTATLPSSLVMSGQPEISVQPPSPARALPGGVPVSAPASVSRAPFRRSLWLAAAAPPVCRQIVPPSAWRAMTSLARLTPMS